MVCLCEALPRILNYLALLVNVLDDFFDALISHFVVLLHRFSCPLVSFDKVSHLHRVYLASAALNNYCERVLVPHKIVNTQYFACPNKQDLCVYDFVFTALVVFKYKPLLHTTKPVIDDMNAFTFVALLLKDVIFVVNLVGKVDVRVNTN